jgi:hypothetical protein
VVAAAGAGGLGKTGYLFTQPDAGTHQTSCGPPGTGRGSWRGFTPGGEKGKAGGAGGALWQARFYPVAWQEAGPDYWRCPGALFEAQAQ